ncbi:Na+ H+ antiporter [Chlorella sorokiniana]|uniref:Na+ H+ antiporter n=1 Tax=Chlorella sorokiniana TaxID=3076 RepID=A0A2P6U371_CHLSO|nr:Na+ H+ antiporter [Chlorella sorokiniana]|eukprot:PRW60759.1 Na+ H+ antiporter [Chlorella sorokiniana]
MGSNSTSAGHQPDPLHTANLSTALMMALMIVWATLGHRFANSTRFAGEGSAACLLGLVVGAVLLVARHLFHPEVLQSMLSFDAANFFVFFLPPIIFYAGLSVKKKHFFRNFFTIAGYGIMGTYVCFALISLGLYLFLRSYLTFGDCLALGCILAATDSVAALQVISQDRFPLLYSVVFGEGVLNDATSIVILGTIQKFGLDSSEDLTFGLIFMMLLDFLYLLLASAVLGMMFGLVTAYCLRHFHFHHVSQEVALIGMTAYLSYLAGDVFGLSGILALFVCAVAISHYALNNISVESRTTTIYAFHTLSYVSEGVIFVYCGLDALDPLKWQNTEVGEVAWMFWILLILLLVSRAAFVVPVTLAHNRYSDNKLTMREMGTIWWAGLMRGAVSVALVYYYFDPHGMTDDPHLSTVITTTMVVVLISILGFGAATKPLLAYLMGAEEPAGTQGQHGERREEYAQLNGGGEGQEGLYSDDPQWNAQQQCSEGAHTQQQLPDGPVGGDDFGPMVAAAPSAGGMRLRTSTGELAEVAIDGSGDGTPLAGASKGKQAAPGRRPSLQLTVDSRAHPAGALEMGTLPHAAAAHAAPQAGGPAAYGPAAAGRDRVDSGGLDYAPDSKAVMARINRWWKNFDEGYMQPHFGGPSGSRNSSTANLAGQGGATSSGGSGAGHAVQGSGKSFTVPVSRPGG